MCAQKVSLLGENRSINKEKQRTKVVIKEGAGKEVEQRQRVSRTFFIYKQHVSASVENAESTVVQKRRFLVPQVMIPQ